MTILRALLCLFLFTASASAATTFHRGGIGEPDSLDPHLTTTGYAGNIISDMFVGLTTIDSKAKLIPGAAESWTVSPDGKVYTFKMRAGAQWSDGHPVTAQDFEYSFRRMLDPKTAARGAPILGTCAGAILLATAIDDGDAPVLSLLDIAVRRNAFGRQLESFETDLRIDGVRADGGGATMHAVFIRAPELTRVGPKARPIAVLADGRIVAARQGNIVGIAFHPELTGESRLHRWLAREAAGFDISSARR